MCWNIHGMNGHGRKQKGEKEKKMLGFGNGPLCEY